MTEDQILEKNRKVNNELQQFEEMVNYCKNKYRCRHQMIAEAFGETTGRCRNKCDICL